MSELLELGFEPCGALYLTVGIRFEACGRPVNHPYPHRAIATERDVVCAPYPDPDPHGILDDQAELEDRAFDARAWS